MTHFVPKLYWISGSPPAWRVMLAMVLKGIDFASHPLDHGAGENRELEYLALNPTGQVPTLVRGDLVIRESVAILAWLDRAYPERPIFGRNADGAARVWQDVITFENDLRPASTTVARGLLRGTADAPEWADAARTLEREIDALAPRLDASPFLGGDEPTASDIWLYPMLGWIARGVDRADAAAPTVARNLLTGRPWLAAWHERFAALPGVADTYPPHWRST